jgi:hypothetical protein
MSDPSREAIHDAIQEHGRMGVDDGAVLTGWTLVAEWMTPDGERWLSKAHGAHTTSWAAKGMMHEALFGQWPDNDSENPGDD